MMGNHFLKENRSILKKILDVIKQKQWQTFKIMENQTYHKKLT
jgi:uncharacterized protein YlxP (DUF503 family)